MDFRHLIVTCLFSMLRLSFETQKIKENYAILQYMGGDFWGVPLVSLAAFTPFCDVMSFQGREFTGSHAPA